MATLTVNRYLDAAACTAGEAFTLNGARLTVRTDTRVHANAPAAMTGSLGAVTVSSTLGGGYTINSTQVRWMPFDTGSGTVPAIGTLVTQGGVSGYLLGVWAAINSAPTAVAAAMPATGFLKFREVTGGAFAAGALTGITANATSPDVVGWIEVVHDQAIAITVPRLGDFTVQGAWFDLGTTTGVANQVLQLPTNGSATSYVPGVWIANTDTPTTDDDYDFYPGLYAAAMIATNLGTDARSKFVCTTTTGSLRIGHNGTTAVGYLPPAGRKIRIPNIFGVNCLTTTRAVNAIPNATAATRPDFNVSGAGAVVIDIACLDWYLSFAQPYSVHMHNVATFDFFAVSECATALDMYDCGIGTATSIDARTFTSTSNFAGGTVEKLNAPRHASGTTDHAVEVLYCKDINFINCDSGIITFARSTGMSYQVTQSDNINFINCRSYNSALQFTTAANCNVTNYDHCDRYVGSTTTAGIYAIYILATSDAIVIDGVTFGLGGTIANVHPYNGVLNYGQSKNCKFRNMGTRSAFRSGGSTNNPAYIAVSSGNNQNCKFQRLYLSPTRTGAISTTNSDKGHVYEHVYGDAADAMATAELNGHIKNCGGTLGTTGQVSVYGTHFLDAFSSDTTDRVTWMANEPTAETAAYVTFVAGTPKFTSAGGLVLATVGDEVIVEQDYWVLACTALQNTAPVFSGTNITYSSGAAWGNHYVYFQCDTGSGWNGTWLDLTAANLATFNSINPAIGFKVKYRLVGKTTSTANLLTSIRIAATSTLAAQAANMYPLDTFTLTLNGLISGSDITVLVAGSETVLSNTEDYAGTSFPYVYETPQTVDIVLNKPGYFPTAIRGYALASANASLPVNQAPDPSKL